MTTFHIFFSNNQAGGASTHSALSTAMTSIQEGLKNSDWATRKAACAALGDIASVGGAFFSAFKSSSIRTLESCRFDKVRVAVRINIEQCGKLPCGGCLIWKLKMSNLICFVQVKPVRDSALQALHMWKRLPGHGTSEPSEAGSSIKGMLVSAL